VEGYAANAWAGGRAAGTPSDDTQLAFWTLEQLVADGGLDPDRLARRLASQRIFGLGRTVRQFLKNYKAGGNWQTAGVASARNGALMRIARRCATRANAGAPARTCSRPCPRAAPRRTTTATPST
jgi:ADP-ribosylglycohydrolase